MSQQCLQDPTNGKDVEKIPCQINVIKGVRRPAGENLGDHDGKESGCHQPHQPEHDEAYPPGEPLTSRQRVRKHQQDHHAGPAETINRENEHREQVVGDSHPRSAAEDQTQHNE